MPPSAPAPPAPRPQGRSFAWAVLLEAPSRRWSDRVWSQLPAWVGVAWNLLLGLTCAFMAASCAVATFRPNPADVELDLWFRALEYFGMVFAPVAGTCWLAADKRRALGALLRRAPGLARVRPANVCAASAALWVLVVVLHTVLYA